LSMDVVSFETAKKLKEAGFPQPEPAFGQVWYESAGSPIIVTSGWEAGFAFVGPRSAMTQTTYMKRFQEQNGVFAPTATDILRQIQQADEWIRYYLEPETDEDGRACFLVHREDRRQEAFDLINVAGNTNPAEAVAATWLAQTSTIKLMMP
jgi:hypothetical protein